DLTAALPNHVSALEQKLRATSEDQLPALHAVLPMSVLAKYWRLPSPAAARRLLAVTASPSPAVLILQIAFRILSHTSAGTGPSRSEEHTSELQSRFDLVCRLLLAKIKKTYRILTFDR